MEGQPIAHLKRGIAVSALLGIGLVGESLTLTPTQLRYNGVERRFGFWQWRRVLQTVHLRDVDSVTTSVSMYPWLVVLAAICAFNLVANFLRLGWWWPLQVWRLPYFFVLETPLITATEDWFATHGITLGVYLALIVLTRRTHLVFDAGVHSPIQCRVDGISAARRNAFVRAFAAAWSSAKADAGAPITVAPEHVLADTA